MVVGKTISKFSQPWYGVVLRVDADGNKLNDAVIVIYKGILEPFHAFCHLGADSRAPGKKEINHQYFPFQRIKGNRFSQLIDQMNVLNLVPDGIGGFFSVFNIGNNGIVIKPAGHYYSFISKMFYQQVTYQR